MKSQALIESISNEFGRSRSRELKRSLEKLLEIYSFELGVTKDICKLVAKPFAKKMSAYSRAIVYIKSIDLTGWHNITEIPEDIFNEFWAIMEMHHEIELDAAREFQYFRVNNFRQRNTTL